MIDFKGKALRLADTDLPELGSLIGVGEDEIHAFLDTESAGHGFDKQGRPTMLFEPHVFFRHLSGTFQDRAVRLGLAYQRWAGPGSYPADSYPRLIEAMAIDETAALKSASWGYGQILGINHALIGYPTPQAMVAAFCDSEKSQVNGIIDFLIANHLDGALRAHDWKALAAGYNGAAFAKNGYDAKLAANFKHWQGIKDTPWKPAPMAPPIAPRPAPVPVNVSPAPIPPIVSNPLPAPSQSVLKGLWAWRQSIFKKPAPVGNRLSLGVTNMNGSKTYVIGGGLAGLSTGAIFTYILAIVGHLDPQVVALIMGWLVSLLVVGMIWALRHGVSKSELNILQVLAQMGEKLQDPTISATATMIDKAIADAETQYDAAPK